MLNALRSLLAGSLSFAIAFAGGPITKAAAAPSGASSTDAIALKKFEDGKAHYEKGEFEEAILAFQASLALLPSPNSRLYIARCYRALGKVASAYTSFKLSMREAQDRLNATGEKRYGATRDAAAKELADIEPKVPRLTLAVPSDVPDAFVVKLDDQAIPESAWGAAFEVDPGAHTVTASGPRQVPFDAKITLKEGEQLRLDVKSPHVATATIALAFATKPSGMSVLLDSVAVDPTKIEQPVELDVGAHSVSVRAPGYREFTWARALVDGERTRVDVVLTAAELPSASGTPRWAFYVATGAAAVSLGVGTLFALQAKSGADAETAKDPLQRDPAERDRLKGVQTRANICLVAGGLFAVGAVVLAFTTKWKSDAPTPTDKAAIAPWIGASSGGLLAAGSF